jgi:Skp family chaperone for outer membrane proteins
MQQTQGTGKGKASPAALIIAIIALAGCLSAIGLGMINGRTIPKIGVVDNAVLLSNFADAIAARQQLDVEKKRWQDNIHSLEDSAKASFEAMRLNYDKASAARRQEMEKRLERWNTELTRYSRAVDDMTKQKENELLKPVVERLNSYVRMWATKRGFQIVIGTGNGGVILSATDQVNLTARILDDLNKYYGKPPLPVSPDTSNRALSGGNKDTSTIKLKIEK